MSDERLGTDDCDDLQDRRKPSIQLDKEHAIAISKRDAPIHDPAQHNNLVLERSIFGFKYHTRLRSIVDEAFRRRAILDMELRIFAIADELAAELFADGSPADLVERYARKLPLSVICELLGLPRADRPRFIAWANNLTRLTGIVSFLRMVAGIGPMRRYLEGRLQAARDSGGEGLIAELVRVEKEGGRISGQEMVAMVFLLLGAGSETTTHLISGSVYELT